MRRAAILTALAATVLSGGCGGADNATPVACLNGPGAYLKALEAAPGPVTLAGAVPISDCLAKNQTAGDLAAVGDAMLAATTMLNGEAREDPGGAANVRLGYLLGAEQRGAEETEGIHAELTRRLVAAANYSPGRQVLGKDFERAYREAYDAGRASG